MKDVFESLGVTLEYKVGKLKKVVDISIPEEEGQKLMGKTGIDAIAELNKMQGHYAAEKKEVKVEMDLDEAAEIVEDAKREIDEIKSF